MPPLFDDEQPGVHSERIKYDTEYKSMLEPGQLECATEMILRVNPSTSKLQVLLSNRLGKDKGLQITGGKRDPEDEDILATAERESDEEANVKPSDKSNLYFGFEGTSVVDVYAMTCRITLLNNSQEVYPIPENEKGKMTDWKWYDLDELLRLVNDNSKEVLWALRKLVNNPLFRKNLIEYINALEEKEGIPPQNEIILMLQAES
jgi:8-oxo-dGTP pyrophosphatase MutT (NUDIX family)